jgi:23S rRNA (guanosine2251-2'-O)-methyltransferase
MAIKLTILSMRTCVLILENLRSVENTASILRTADGLGVAKIILVGTTPAPIDRFGRKRSDFAKVSLGAEESVDWHYAGDIDVAMESLDEDFQIISLELTHDSLDVRDFKPTDKFALIVGNEVDGVSARALKRASVSVEIPMQGKKESLNVSVATGIALYMLI